MPAKFSRVVGRYVYVTVKGVEYRVYFEEAGQGMPVLFQHTAGSDGRQWRYLAGIVGADLEVPLHRARSALSRQVAAAPQQAVVERTLFA